MSGKAPHGFEPLDYEPALPDDDTPLIVVVRATPEFLCYVGPFPNIESVVRWLDAHCDLDCSVVGLIDPTDFLGDPDTGGDDAEKEP